MQGEKDENTSKENLKSTGDRERGYREKNLTGHVSYIIMH